jgi:hypothetical protein
MRNDFTNSRGPNATSGSSSMHQKGGLIVALISRIGSGMKYGKLNIIQRN